MENLVPVRLCHLGVNEEAGVAQLRDFLRQKLHTLHGVAEDDALVDLQLGEESVQAVHLLALLNVSIVLRHALQSELIHEVYRVGRFQILLLQTKHSTLH